MGWQEWAILIASIITALGAIVATNYSEIAIVLRKSATKIDGEWEVKSYRISVIPPDDESNRTWIGEYVLKLKQRGSLVKGEMIATKVKEGMIPLTYNWKGEILGDYLIYQCKAAKHPNPFTISSSVLVISSLGNEMSGYFVANNAPDKHRCFVGFTDLRKRN